MFERFFKLIGKPTSVTIFNKLNPSAKKMLSSKVQKDVMHYGNEIDGDFINDNYQQKVGFCKYTSADKYNLEINNKLVETKTLLLDYNQKITKEIWLIDRSYIREQKVDKLSPISVQYVEKAEKALNNNIIQNDGLVSYTEGLIDRSLKTAKFDKVFTKTNKVKYLHEKVDKNNDIIKKMLDD